ncbi:MAG TPA: response regulator [Terriglobales bacterium]|nr:response regulator [Terriglobales bacterium]
MTKRFQASDYRVLVVDDEPSVLFTYRMILEQEGYKTTAVPSAREALELVRRNDYHIVLCDYSLEEKHTGFEVIDAARQRRKDLPCVLLTGYANQETVAQAEAAGVGVLFKPIDIDEFLAAIPAKLRETYEQSAAHCN